MTEEQRKKEKDREPMTVQKLKDSLGREGELIKLLRGESSPLAL